ncbi:MAG: phosphoglucosamine mutase [Candidatus Methanomethylophilaceae archaeon]|nr:phosphoglucosamine mutase [Candidatus Methanomethylophilaceae archaeon]
MTMKMFGTNGIRGIVNGYMTPELALKVGKAIAEVLGPGVIAIAKDTRTSSDMVVCAVESGLLSMGIDIMDLGMVPTPALQYYVRTHPNVAAGVMITASHNPPEFNGIKCVSSDGTECSHEEEAAIESAYEMDLECPGWDGVGSITRISDAGEAYIDAVVSKVDAGLIREAGLKVCLDCSNGAASLTSPLLMKKLGVKALTINASPDGRFPGHYSEPTEDNLADLKRLTAESGCDLGMAHDGDADRCVFVTGSGRYVPGDQSLAILGRSAISKNGGGKVVTTVAASRVIEESVVSAGGEIVYTAVGSPIVAREMMADGAVFGGEENGGLIFADHQYCRDGAMAIAKMLEAVAKDGSLDSQVDSLPKYFTIKAAVQCPDDLKSLVINDIARRHEGERANLTDGLRIDYDDGWVLMRPSGTEPKFRVYSESKDKAAAERRSREFLMEASDIIGRRRSTNHL